MTIKEIAELRKNGETDRAYSEASRLHSADPADVAARVELARCIRPLMGAAARQGDDATLVRLLGEFASLRLEEAGEGELNNGTAWDVRAMVLRWKADGMSDAAKARRLFDAVTEIGYVRPHRYYSILLDAFLKVGESFGNTWPDIVEAVGWWGLENLMPEDFQRVRLTNGRTEASLVERAYTAVCKAVIAGLAQGIMQDEAEAFVSDLEALEESHPECHYALGQRIGLLRAMGHYDAAANAARALVRRRQTDCGAWSLLGDIAPDDETRLACYCRALMCKAPAQLLGNVRYKLAVLMCKLGYYANGRREFGKIVSLYDYKGWQLPAEVEAVVSQPWYVETAPSVSNRDFYASHVGEAEAFLMGDIPEVPVLVTRYNVQKQICNYATADRKRGFFSTRKLGGQFADHQIWMVRFAGEPGGEGMSNVVSCRRVTDITPYDGVFYRHTEAEINMRPGMAFLFVDDIYVDGTLLRGIQPGSYATITAVLYYNIKKETLGWRAVRLTPA